MCNDMLVLEKVAPNALMMEESHLELKILKYLLNYLD